MLIVCLCVNVDFKHLHDTRKVVPYLIPKMICIILIRQVKDHNVNEFRNTLPHAKISYWSCQDVQREDCEFSGGECGDPGSRRSSAHMHHTPGNMWAVIFGKYNDVKQ